MNLTASLRLLIPVMLIVNEVSPKRQNRQVNEYCEVQCCLAPYAYATLNRKLKM